MTNETPTNPGTDEAIITLEGEDGTSYNCQILDIIEFDGQEYGILLKLKAADDKTPPVEDADGEEEESLVIMRLIQRDDQSIFRTIESDDEFEKVVAYVEELARAAAGAEE
ncbi:MAG: DUF1292 domain-containing protein [Candidatus Melainabacteria bacterium]|nr:DUF1292 domain-containing protein [Candidatus Melainabacteria bacterium]